MKDIVNKLLEYSRTIAQAKWHHQVFQVTVRSDEGRLKLIPFSDAHQIVSGAQVQFGKDAGLRERVEYCLEPKEGVAVLNGDLV